MLDSESPMFPSCVWSDPTPAYPTPRYSTTTSKTDAREMTRTRNENTKTSPPQVPTAGRPAGRRVGRSPPRARARRTRRTPSGRLSPSGGGGEPRAIVFPGVSSARDRRRDASRRRRRRQTRHRRVATGGHESLRGRARERVRVCPAETPVVASPPPPRPEAATPVPYLPEQPNVLASEDSAAEVAAEMAAVARVSALAGGDAFRAREPAPLRWSELAFGPTQSAARDEDDGARGFDALSEGDDVERSIKLSDELSDEDEESVDVRPYAPGVSLEALVRARDDDLTATLARGGRTGRWVPLRPSGGIGAARAAGEEDAGATYDEDAGATYNAAMVASAVEELGDGEGAPGGVEADQNLVRKQEDDAEARARGVDPCAATTAARERASEPRPRAPRERRPRRPPRARRPRTRPPGVPSTELRVRSRGPGTA